MFTNKWSLLHHTDKETIVYNISTQIYIIYIPLVPKPKKKNHLSNMQNYNIIYKAYNLKYKSSIFQVKFIPPNNKSLDYQ